MYSTMRFLHVFQAMVILVEHPAHVGDVEVILGLIRPRQLGQPLQMGANDVGLGRPLA